MCLAGYTGRPGSWLRPDISHGNIGSAERLSYTLVGDAVNVASRLQSLTKEVGCDILVSADTRRHLDGDFALTPLPAVRVKGKSDEVEVFRLG